jgi:hypothetical protein
MVTLKAMATGDQELVLQAELASKVLEAGKAGME